MLIASDFEQKVTHKKFCSLSMSFLGVCFSKCQLHLTQYSPNFRSLLVTLERVSNQFTPRLLF